MTKYLISNEWVTKSLEQDILIQRCVVLIVPCEYRSCPLSKGCKSGTGIETLSLPKEVNASNTCKEYTILTRKEKKVDSVILPGQIFYLLLLYRILKNSQLHSKTNNVHLTCVKDALNVIQVIRYISTL